METLVPFLPENQQSFPRRKLPCLSLTAPRPHMQGLIASFFFFFYAFPGKNRPESDLWIVTSMSYLCFMAVFSVYICWISPRHEKPSGKGQYFSLSHSLTLSVPLNKGIKIASSSLLTIIKAISRKSLCNGLPVCMMVPVTLLVLSSSIL